MARSFYFWPPQHWNGELITGLLLGPKLPLPKVRMVSLKCPTTFGKPTCEAFGINLLAIERICFFEVFLLFFRLSRESCFLPDLIGPQDTQVSYCSWTVLLPDFLPLPQYFHRRYQGTHRIFLSLDLWFYSTGQKISIWTPLFRGDHLGDKSHIWIKSVPKNSCVFGFTSGGR